MSLRIAALLLTVAISTRASAAGIVTLRQDNLGGGQSALYVQNSLDVELGGFIVLVSGASGFTLEPSNPAISVLDSGYVTDPGGGPDDALAIFGHLPVPLLPAHSAEVLLGVFQVAPGHEFPILGPADSLYGGSLFGVDSAVTPILYDSFLNRPCDAPACAPLAEFEVPEPASLSLLGSLGVWAALYLGGNRRRRNASVGAPT